MSNSHFVRMRRGVAHSDCGCRILRPVSRSSHGDTWTFIDVWYVRSSKLECKIIADLRPTARGKVSREQHHGGS
jgi:hypothetical protein